jgi:hypothetical protein
MEATSMRSVKHRVLLAFAVLGTVAAFAATLVPVAGADTTSGFAIGDEDARVGAHVMFWGAQWWKENDLSTDVTRPSFKGWATTVDAAKCSFTTRTGDSPPPPDGPLPEYITAVVTSKVTQSGYVINGTVTAFALIKIDPGYDGNPGHDGWGTVVDLLSCTVVPSGGGDL